MSGLSKALITTAGAAPEKPAGSERKALSRELARRLRAAKTDDEAADVVDAIVELARTPEE